MILLHILPDVIESYGISKLDFDVKQVRDNYWAILRNVCKISQDSSGEITIGHLTDDFIWRSIGGASSEQRNLALNRVDDDASW